MHISSNKYSPVGNDYRKRTGSFLLSFYLPCRLKCRVSQRTHPPYKIAINSTSSIAFILFLFYRVQSSTRRAIATLAPVVCTPCLLPAIKTILHLHPSIPPMYLCFLLLSLSVSPFLYVSCFSQNYQRFKINTIL